MARVDRVAAVQLVASWLGGLSDGRLTARLSRSERGDIEVTDTRTRRAYPIKVAVREISKSARQGKNFQVRESVLRSDPRGIVVLLYLNDESLRRDGETVKAAWVLPYARFLSQPAGLSSTGTYQCRPLFSPTERDDWSPYRCFSEKEVVGRVLSIVEARDA